MTDNRKPINQIRLPGGIKATTWMNVSKNGNSFTTTTITRTFKTEDGFKDSSAFTHDELLKVAKIADQAFEAISELKEAEKEKPE